MAMLRETWISPEQTAAMPNYKYLKYLFNDKGCQMLRE
jgi:hypothetical protein